MRRAKVAFTVREAARRAGADPETGERLLRSRDVRSYIRAGELFAVRVCGSWLIHGEDLDEFLTTRGLTEGAR